MKTKKPRHYEVKEPQEAYSGLKSKDLNELAASILKLIGEDKQKRATLVGLLVSDVATKQEFTTILEELRAIREDSDRKFEAIGKRFEAADKRFEAIEAELKAMREDSDRKFEASEKRFEAIDKRFEDADKRFETIETELKAMREDSDRKFEAVDERFDAMDKKFEEQREDFRMAIQASYQSLSNKIDALGSRWGIMAEKTFSRALSEILSKVGFQVSKWRKTDTKGEIFTRPRDVEIDILVKNGKRIAIEIKSAIGIGDIEMFQKAVQFYEKSESVKVDDKIMVGIHLHREVDEYAKELGIKIVSQIEDVVE